MVFSMTGFGRCLVENGGITQQWEVKSVNSRHLDLKWRLPACARSLEPRLEKDGWTSACSCSSPRTVCRR